MPAIHARRGRCPHRPETWRAEPAGINVLPSHRTIGTMRASSPTRWENFAIHQAPFFTFRCPLHTRRKRGHPLQAGEGRGFPAAKGAVPGRFCVPPHTRRCGGTLSQERVRGFSEIVFSMFPSHRQRGGVWHRKGYQTGAGWRKTRWVS